jgi:hypothetical protein
MTPPLNPNLDAVRVQLKYIYNAYRTESLNRKYYGVKLAKCQRYNSYMEIAIAVGATGSGGVAGLAIWGTITGQYAWGIISGIATILSVVKPVIQLGKTIERYTKLHSGHTTIFLELRSIVEDIEIAKAIPRRTEDKYNSIKQTIKELGGLEDVNRDSGLAVELQRLVNVEIPSEDLWMP